MPFLSGTASAASSGSSVPGAGVLPYVPDARRTGPVSTDAPTITLGVAADATYNEQYVLGANALPAVWPVDCFGAMSIANNLWSAKTSDNAVGSVATYRMMFDGTDLFVFTYAAPFAIDLYIDGQPYAGNPIAPAASTGYAPFGFQKLVWATAKPRLIEFRMIGGLVGVYTKKPYRIWKPSADNNPKVAVVGDSYVGPTVMSDTVAGSAGGDIYLAGMYQRMAALLGITSMTSDGIGGTGYLAPGGANKPYTHASRIAWLQALNPDVIIVHGGGANDFYNGYTLAATTTAAVGHFTNLHSLLPDARLVFVESVNAPLAGFNNHQADAVALRQAVQSQLAAAGVPAYFLDMQTTRQPINGTGYVTAANASGNSDIYIGSDSVHPTVKGHTYYRHLLAKKVSRVLADDGALIGSLIL